MTNYVTLLGAEDVARAGRHMLDAAESIGRSIGYLEESLQRAATRFDEAVARITAGGKVEEDRKGFEAWAIVELFGHQKTAGRVSEQQVGGETFVRVDVPLVEPEKFATALYGKGAIYAIKIVDEPIAREYARQCEPRPVHSYDVKALLADQRRPSDDADDYP